MIYLFGPTFSKLLIPGNLLRAKFDKIINLILSVPVDNNKISPEYKETKFSYRTTF